jgi:DNA mismatch endonuclease, patch repair protein
VPTVAAAAATVRSVLHRLGYRFRLGGAGLPGSPEVVLPRWRLAIFIVDCGRHPHADCTHAVEAPPAAEVRAEARRLERAEPELVRQGWRTLVVQVCDAADPDALGYRLDIALQGRLIAAADTSPGAT